MYWKLSIDFKILKTEWKTINNFKVSLYQEEMIMTVLGGKYFISEICKPSNCAGGGIYVADMNSSDLPACLSAMTQSHNNQWWWWGNETDWGGRGVLNNTRWRHAPRRASKANGSPYLVAMTTCHVRGKITWYRLLHRYAWANTTIYVYFLSKRDLRIKEKQTAHY